MNDLTLGWALMGYGLLGVFITLAIFMLAIKVMVNLFPRREDGGRIEEPGE